MSPGHIDGTGHTYIGNLFSTDFLNKIFEFLEIDVSFERMGVLRIVSLVDDDINEFTAGKFLVFACSCEIHIAGNIVARFNHYFRDQVFRRPPLVSWNEVRHSVIFFHIIP